MSKELASREGFIGRWSRRKLTPERKRSDEPQSAPAQAAVEHSDAFADFDFASLDFASDYRRFMDAAVPDHVRTRALHRLWSASDVISQPDELDEFLEDFRDEAKALPADLVRSAYKVGRGFVDEAGNGETPVPDERSLEAAEAAELRPEDARSADAPDDKSAFQAASGEQDDGRTAAQRARQPSEHKG